jgi:hypothetical protein
VLLEELLEQDYALLAEEVCMVQHKHMARSGTLAEKNVRRPLVRLQDGLHIVLVLERHTGHIESLVDPRDFIDEALLLGLGRRPTVFHRRRDFTAVTVATLELPAFRL